MIAHGTYSGYHAEIRQRIEPCTECRRANAAYHREYRAKNPDRRRKDAEQSEARHRAHQRLAALHPGLFQILLAEELARFQ